MLSYYEDDAWGLGADDAAGWDAADNYVKSQKETITKRVCKNADCSEKLTVWDINSRGGECRDCYYKDEEF